MKRGEIYLADLSPHTGSEQGGVRPVVIIQNNIGNKHSPTIIVAAITSQTHKFKLPTHAEILPNSLNGLTEHSIIICEQIRTIDKLRLKQKLGEIDKQTHIRLNAAIRASLEL